MDLLHLSHSIFGLVCLVCLVSSYFSRFDLGDLERLIDCWTFVCGGLFGFDLVIIFEGWNSLDLSKSESADLDGSESEWNSINHGGDDKRCSARYKLGDLHQAISDSWGYLSGMSAEFASGAYLADSGKLQISHCPLH